MGGHRCGKGIKQTAPTLAGAVFICGFVCHSNCRYPAHGPRIVAHPRTRAHNKKPANNRGPFAFRAGRIQYLRLAFIVCLIGILWRVPAINTTARCAPMRGLQHEGALLASWRIITKNPLVGGLFAQLCYFLAPLFFSRIS